MREYSTPAVTEVAPTARLTDIVFDRAAHDPGAVILRRKAGPSLIGGTAQDTGAGLWQDVTAQAFAADVVTLAKGLIAADISEGDRVALMSRTRYEWTLMDYAIWAAGAVTVPIYETSSAEQVEWILGDSGARAVVVETSSHLRTVTEVLERLPAVSQVWQMEEPAPTGQPTEPTPAGSRADERDLGKPAIVESLRSLAAEGGNVTDEQAERRRNSRAATDLATIIYTSGTTGRPKGCTLTHGNLLASVCNAIRGPLAGVFDMPEASTLLFLPLAHVFARVIQVGCLEAGVVLGHTADVSGLLPDLASFQPTFILAVPRVFEKVYNGAEQKAAASKIRGLIFHAAAQTAIAWSRASGETGTSASGGPGLRARRALFDHLVYGKLRAAVGGRVSYAVSGGAPLGERLGHFFRGAGITI
ncbi:MAG TPA: AMP-binding protein, partial [Streptosporangiaceae bacterium]